LKDLQIFFDLRFKGSSSGFANFLSSFVAVLYLTAIASFIYSLGF
jgi:hypothetical protein